MEPNLTIYSEPLKKYGKRPQRFFISKFLIAAIIIGIAIFLLIPNSVTNNSQGLNILSIILIVIGLYIFLFPSKRYQLKKNGNRIHIGMHIDEVREILEGFHIEKDGYNRNDEYCVIFKERKFLGKDFEGVSVVFFQNKVVDIDFSYHRTTTTTYYY